MDKHNDGAIADTRICVKDFRGFEIEVGHIERQVNEMMYWVSEDCWTIYTVKDETEYAATFEFIKALKLYMVTPT